MYILSYLNRKTIYMTIEKQPQAIICGYCQNADYYYEDKHSVWSQAKANGWLIYKGQHFDSGQCLNNYKKGKDPHEIRIEDFYD